jgi:uncharacterized protein YycO
MGTVATQIPRFDVQLFEAGKSVQEFAPGDFLLTHGKSWTSYLIRFGESLRYWGPRRKYTHWSHTAIFVNQDGDLIEALGGGVQKRNVAVYRDTEYHVVRLIDVPEEERENAVAFAQHCLEDHYGFFTIASLAVTLVSGSKFFFGVDGQMICSGLVARALERMGAIFQFDSWHMMPADLAEAFRVSSASGASKGNIPATKLSVTAHST